MGAAYADLDLLRDTGAVYVFGGGKDLVGAVAPTAELRAANPTYYDRMGRTVASRSTDAILRRHA